VKFLIKMYTKAYSDVILTFLKYVIFNYINKEKCYIQKNYNIYLNCEARKSIEYVSKKVFLVEYMI